LDYARMVPMTDTDEDEFNPQNPAG
jgi:hypothetical protein